MNEEFLHRIGILMADKSNPFWIDMKRHYDRLSRNMGIESEYFWPIPPGDPSAQSKMLMEMVAYGFDVIIINPLNNNNLVSGIFKASDRKIPILDVGGKTNQVLVKGAEPHYLAVQTVDFYQQGKLGSEYISSRLKPGKGNKVAILEGRSDSAQSIGRSKGAADIFGNDPKIQLLFKEQADFDRKKASITTKILFKNEPKIDAFFCVNDLMALGVADAVSQLKIPKRPIIVGVDLIDEAKKAIKIGVINASVAFSRAQVAAGILKKAIEIIDGEEHSTLFPISSYLVSLENVDDFDD